MTALLIFLVRAVTSHIQRALGQFATHGHHGHHNQIIIQPQMGYQQPGIYVQAQPTFQAQVVYGQAQPGYGQPGMYTQGQQPYPQYPQKVRELMA